MNYVKWELHTVALTNLENTAVFDEATKLVIHYKLALATGTGDNCLAIVFN